MRNDWLEAVRAVTTAIRTRRDCAVYGSTGSGKTMVLRQALGEALRDGHHIAVLAQRDDAYGCLARNFRSIETHCIPRPPGAAVERGMLESFAREVARTADILVLDDAVDRVEVERVSSRLPRAVVIAVEYAPHRHVGVRIEDRAKAGGRPTLAAVTS